MKKILILFVLVLCLLQLKQAKKDSKYKNQQQNSQLEPHHQRSSKDSKNPIKQPRPESTKKHTKNIKHSKHSHSSEHHYLHPDQPAFWWNTILAILLSCAGGFFSGMTVGLNSLDKLTLQVQKITGNDDQKQRASRILNTIKDHHLFLVTLLVGNAMVLEYLPLVVHKLVPDWAAILISTFAVVIVAEIVPMAYTTGPSKYKVAYLCAPLVDLCIKVYYVIAYPIARGLDKLLGIHDNTHIKRTDFLSFVNDKKANQLKPLQITLFNQFFVGPSFASVESIMTPVNQVSVLAMSDQITQELASDIAKNQVMYVLIAQNQSRIQNFNLLAAVRIQAFVKQYLKKKIQLKKANLRIEQFLNPSFVIDPLGQPNRQAILKYNLSHRIPVVYSDAGLLDLLKILKTRKASLALIHKDKRRNQSTDIAFLDSSDFEVFYDPFSVQDKDSIIGMVMIENLLEAITDFDNQITPQFEFVKQETPKKRKLVKKASIVSSYSARSQRQI